MSEPLRRRMRAQLLRGLTRTGGWLPDPVLAATFGSLQRLAGRSRFARLARENLAHAAAALAPERAPLDELERERILRAVFRHSARQLREWMQLARGAPPEGPGAARGFWIDQAVRLDDSIDRLHAERERSGGRGVIIVTAHIGNWELLCARLRRLGLRGTVVGRRRPKDSSASWLIEMRRAYGVETLPQDSSPRTLLRSLRDGQTVGLLSDLEVRRLGGVFLPFLGRPALTMTAPAALARAHRAPLLPVRCTLDPGAEHYTLRVEKPLWLDERLDRREATVDLCERLNRVFEGWICETPEQWAWHQPRWRTRPGSHAALPLAARTTAQAAEEEAR